MKIAYKVAAKACEGGGHFDVTVSFDDYTFSWKMSREEMSTIPHKKEVNKALFTLARLLLNGKTTLDEVKNVLDNKAISSSDAAKDEGKA